MKSFVDFIRNNVGHVLSWSSERVPGRGSDRVTLSSSVSRTRQRLISDKWSGWAD